MKKLLLIAILGLFIFPKNFAQTVSTLAGSTQGYVDATGAAAKFYGPYGVTVDASGTVYVTDRNNNKIRKITSSGVVTTLAGSTLGYTDGIGTSAQFSSPAGICVDASGTIYVAEEGCKIRRVTQSGEVSTVAGSSQGYVDATGTIARFDVPTGICKESSGNLFVADCYNNKIRKITPEGVVTTFAGSTYGYVDATGISAQFYYPYGICVDAAGTIYVSDNHNSKIRKITAEGVVTTLAGSTEGFADGTGSEAQFNHPSGLCVDPSGNVYVADFNNNRIRKITPDGVVSTFAGSTGGYVNGTISNAKFSNPLDVCIDTSGAMYVADFGNNRIRKIMLALDVAEEHIPNLTMTLYPIPTSNTINVRVNPLLLDSPYSISDQRGRVVLSGKVNEENTTINIENLSNGMYIFSTEGQSKTNIKFVKN